MTGDIASAQPNDESLLLGKLYHSQDRLDEAMQALTESLDDRYGVADVLHFLSELSLFRGDIDKGEEYIRKALVVYWHLVFAEAFLLPHGHNGSLDSEISTTVQWFVKVLQFLSLAF